MDALDDQEAENLANTQRLKAALHYSTGQICEEQGTQNDVTFDKQFIAALSETTFRYSQTMTRDLELFAKHAKRSTINTDDCKLLVRKTPQLVEHVQYLTDQLQASALEKKQKRSKKRPKAAEPQIDDDDSNTA